METKRLAACLVALVATGFLSGCAPGLEPGSVAVEIRPIVPAVQGGKYEVRVVGPDGALIFSAAMRAGESLSRADIPLGWVSISADPLCTVEAELTPDQPAMGLIVDGSNCALTDGKDAQSSP